MIKNFKIFKEKPDQSIFIGLLLVLAGLIIFTPTVKTLRSVEIYPKTKSIALEVNEMLAQDVLVPAGFFDYLFLWVDDGLGAKIPKPSDYKSLKLEVKDSGGKVLRVVDKPKLIKRDDRPALRFNFKTINSLGTERYSFTAKQVQPDKIRVFQPLPDHVKAGETTQAAFQLSEKKTLVALLIDKVYEDDFVGHDIAFYHYRGTQIVEGVNPYSCVLDEGETCHGYPAHLPGMYLVAAGFVAAGVDSLPEWEVAWRPVLIASWLAIGIVLLVYIYRLGQAALAVATLGFWLFNRWSLQVLRIAHTDFVGVLLMLLSVLLVNRAPLVAATLLGASLAVKQVAILIVPAFLIYVWRVQKPSQKRFALIVFLVALVPVIVTVPFLLNDFDATSKALVNIVERPAQSEHGFAPSLDAWLDITHFGKSALMLLLVLAVYVAQWRKKINLTSASLIVFAIIMAFTHVLFNQYLVWFIPFIPLAVASLNKK